MQRLSLKGFNRKRDLLFFLTNSNLALRNCILTTKSNYQDKVELHREINDQNCKKEKHIVNLTTLAADACMKISIETDCFRIYSRIRRSYIRISYILKDSSDVWGFQVWLLVTIQADFRSVALRAKPIRKIVIKFWSLNSINAHSSLSCYAEKRKQ